MQLLVSKKALKSPEDPDAESNDFSAEDEMEDY